MPSFPSHPQPAPLPFFDCICSDPSSHATWGPDSGVIRGAARGVRRAGRPARVRVGARGRGTAAPTRMCQFCLRVLQRSSYKRHMATCKARQDQVLLSPSAFLSSMLSLLLSCSFTLVHLGGVWSAYSGGDGRAGGGQGHPGERPLPTSTDTWSKGTRRPWTWQRAQPAARWSNLLF